MKTKVFKKFNSEAVKILKGGGIGVIPTDTIYGIVCSALSKKSVNDVYRLRKRSPNKPVIVLVGSLRDLKKFGIMPNAISREALAKLWPGPVSVVLELSYKRQATLLRPAFANATAGKQGFGGQARDKFKYLHRGKNAIAFRMPQKAALRRFLKKTGPLIAPSANFEGEPPAKTIKEAQKYFGNKVGFYIDGGKLKSKPSTLVSIKDGKVCVIRAGTAKITNVSTR